MFIVQRSNSKVTSDLTAPSQDHGSVTLICSHATFSFSFTKTERTCTVYLMYHGSYPLLSSDGDGIFAGQDTMDRRKDRLWLRMTLAMRSHVRI
jgi:hypothetical protein